MFMSLPYTNHGVYLQGAWRPWQDRRFILLSQLLLSKKNPNHQSFANEHSDTPQWYWENVLWVNENKVWIISPDLTE